MADKIFAPLAMLLFVAFVGLLAFYVNEPDLWIVIVVVCALGGFDFWKTVRESKDEAGDETGGRPGA
jgi:hypothetical protein